MRLRAACIQTHHAAAMVDFYAKLFQHEPDVDGGVDFRFYDEQVTVFKLGDVDRPSQPTEQQAPVTTNTALIFAVEDVDAEYERLCELGLCGESAPSDKPWGVRSFMVSDPDGNTVSLTQPIKNK